MFTFKGKKINLSLIFIILIISISLVGIAIYPLINLTTNPQDEDISDIAAKQVNSEILRNIVLITKFVVGKDIIVEKAEVANSVEELKNRYPDYRVIEITDNKIIFEKNVEDLSPDLKIGTPYFGLGPDGHLTLYLGSPADNQVIETFFRIDIERLESSLPKEPVEQLYKGIEIKDLAEFNSVLSTFSEFSIY